MPACKFCQSKNVVKHGLKMGIQRYLCNNCNHHFIDNNIHFPRMRVNEHVIITSLNLYYDGLSTRKVAEQVSAIFGENLSHTTVLSWIQKYTRLVSSYVQTLSPGLSGKYHHDETEIKIGGEGRYFWETIDEDTRFIVAHMISTGRSTEDAKKVFQMGKDKQKPIALFTDGSLAYDNAFYAVFDTPFRSSTTEWVRRVGIRARETNNIVERLHGTLKDRIKPMRGLKHDKTATILLDGYITNYNFCRKHSSIGKTPAEAAGLQVKGWKQLIENAQTEKTNEEVKQRQVMEVKVTRT